MLRSLITSAGVLLLGASAFAQSDVHSLLRPVTSPVRDAGVYHLGLGTWTHHADTAGNALAAGFDGFLEKPIEPQHFVAQIEAYLDRQPVRARA